MATTTAGRPRMKFHGRALTALLVALAVLAFTGGDATRAQPPKTFITVEFYEDGTVKSVSEGGKPLPKSPVPGKYNIISINYVDAVFVKYENSPATCSMWIGGVKYTWQC
jgi:hypothetical protein